MAEEPEKREETRPEEAASEAAPRFSLLGLSPGQIVLVGLALALVIAVAVQLPAVWAGEDRAVAFQVGSLQVRWYGILLMSGAFAGALLGESEARRRGLNPDHVWNILLAGLVLGVLVSRLWWIAGKWDACSGDVLCIAGFQNGQFVGLRGLTIHGALIGAVLAVLLYVLWKRLHFWTWLDVGAPGFVLGQAIGRWGNFFNQEAFGRPTTLPWGLNIPILHRQVESAEMTAYLQGLGATARFHPTFLYESLMDLAICGLLLFLARRFGGRLIRGEIFMLYGILYGLGRFGLEFLRVDSILLGGFPAAQIVSIALVLLCAGVMVARRWIWKRPPG